MQRVNMLQRTCEHMACQYISLAKLLLAVPPCNYITKTMTPVLWWNHGSSHDITKLAGTSLDMRFDTAP
jgi:hypothetical protein